MGIYALDGERPDLSEGVFVAESATVAGRVRLGAGVGIWFGAVIRGDNEWIVIGARTNVQDHCTLHSDAGSPLTIGESCTLGHGAIVHGCTLEENVLIGMGAIVLNGAHIGANSIVGAGALVTEGKTFPPNSLIVGSPAKAVRTLDEAAAQRLRLSAAHYVENARRFANGLERID